MYVLEIGGRAGATCLPELVSTYYGFNYYEQIVRAALDMNPIFQLQSSQPCVCELLISDMEGEIAQLENTNDSHPDIIDISFDYDIGDTARKFRVGTDRIGQIIVKGRRLEDALKLLEEVKSKVHIELKQLES